MVNYMESAFSAEKYAEMIEKLFQRFPSFQKAGASAYKPGIANMEFIDSLMGHPHRNYRVIHVAGTNGKGSVAVMTAEILKLAGYKTGLFTSPFIVDFRERIRINGEFIQKESLIRLTEKVLALNISLTEFELITAVAFLYFKEENCDVAVIETGLGGRFDATNALSVWLLSIPQTTAVSR